MYTKEVRLRLQNMEQAQIQEKKKSEKKVAQLEGQLHEHNCTEQKKQRGGKMSDAHLQLHEEWNAERRDLNDKVRVLQQTRNNLELLNSQMDRELNAKNQKTNE